MRSTLRPSRSTLPLLSFALCCAVACGGGAPSQLVADGGAPDDGGASADGGGASADGGGASADGGGARDGGPPDGGVDFVACIPAPVGPFPPACVGSDRLDEVLAKAGLRRADVRYTAADWSIFPASLTHDAFRLPFFDAIHDEPLRAPAFARGLVATLDLAAASPRPVSASLQVLAGALGHRIDACALPPSPSPQQSDGFVDAMVALHDAPGDADRDAIARDAEHLPVALRAALAPILRAARAAADARNEVFSVLSDELRDAFLLGAHAYFLPSRVAAPPLSNATVRDALASGLDMGKLYQAAARLAATVESAQLQRFAGLRGVSFAQVTPLGSVVVRDAADHVHTAADPDLQGELLFFLDTGGNDTYRIPAGASQSVTNPVSVLVDLAGDDRYEYEPIPDDADGARLPSDEGGRYHPTLPVTQDSGPVSLSPIGRQGSGQLGIGLLFDLGGGRDHYRSLRLSQGCGLLGVGALFDDGGDDVYEAEAGAQGAGAYGIGLLLDQGGSDVYRGYHALQGFGWVRGAGLLYDRAGDDQYLADVGDPERGGDPLYFTPQLPGRGNASFAQGVGFGRRADTTDGIYQSGGLGVLRDLEGRDRYVSSVFGTGSGYWFGTGILADGAGDDRYDGLWYVQGSAAHFALTLFLDDGGNDLYNQTLAPSATSIGVGHDFSVAWHIDLGGDDRYRAPGLSLGAGNVNGVGFFVNVGGDDVYESAGEPTLGVGSLSGEADQPGNPRRLRKTIGVFLDVGGRNTYRVGGVDLARAGTSWEGRRDPDTTITTEHGAGLDAPDGGVCIGP